MARLRWLFLLFPLYGAFASVVQGCGGAVTSGTSDDALGGDHGHEAVPDDPPYGYGYGYGDDR
jgi:hypothetical protein